MARLYDRIMAGGAAPFEDEADLLPNAYEALARAQVVVADNVCEYMMASCDKEVWHYHEDFPNLAPPFNAMWIETTRPSAVVGSHGTLSSAALPAAWGMALFAEFFDEPDPHWVMMGQLWLRGNSMRSWGRGVVGPVGGIVLDVTKSGEVIRSPKRPLGYSVLSWRNSENNGHYHFSEGNGPASSLTHSHVITLLADPLLLAISFMHCKNVERREVMQPPALSKKWARKHGRPLVRYHVLDIDPMKKVLRDEGRSAETGLKRALHICRGHFSTYTEDAPLFGRLTGTFWKPQHIRGSAAEGVVVKDYNVKAPKGVTHA